MKNKGKVFLVDDDKHIVAMLTRTLKKEGYEVNAETAAFKDVVGKIEAWFPDAVLLDIKLPGVSGIDVLKEFKSHGLGGQVIMLTSDQSVDAAVRAMKLGAADYLTKPFNLAELKLVVRSAIEKARLEQEVEQLRKISEDYFERDLIGDSATMKEIRTKIKKIAKAGVSSVLITGESGTGKELLARYLHHVMYGEDASRRPFIGVNCAALSERLLESELFGHVKGAFTDAKEDKKGVFELANTGSLLLDEIGEMRPDLQSKLLRVLEERTFRRVGGKEEFPFKETVVATTNKPLSEAVKRGEFRSDLFFRLSAFYVHIPPLRERKEDIMALVRHFLSYFSSRYKKKTVQGFSPEAEKLLTSYAWPGNVRELKNLVERIVVLESAEKVLPQHLPGWLLDRSVMASDSPDLKFILPKAGVSLEEMIEGIEKDLIMQALDRAAHNKALAARLLNISYDAFRYLIKKFDLG